MDQDPVTPPQLEEAEIQKIILSGYRTHPFGSVILISLNRAKAPGTWLRQIQTLITFGDHGKSPHRFHLAFTASGLKKTGLPENSLSKFSQAFREGSLQERRLRILGDRGSSAPEHWVWGGPGQLEVDLLLMVYAESQEELENALTLAQIDHESIEVIQQSPSDLPPNLREHFGFRDGIVQPAIAGWDTHHAKENTIAAGEFILGYPNAREQFPPSPPVTKVDDPTNTLPENEAKPGGKDFGKNGTYLVYRQLSQDVEGFWKFAREASEKLPDPAHNAKWLASKMVGRWPSGAPLTLSPDRDDPDKMEKTGEYFQYSKVDPDGLRCPFGAHVRRSNPRDCLYPDSHFSTTFTNYHRIIRRGRSYTLSESGEKGLHFICLNSDIENQFEFIQHDWVNSPKFADQLYAESDPISGYQDPKKPERTDSFTIPQEPVRQRVKGLPRFVDVKGSAYFFMPSKSALAYLCGRT